MKRILKFQLYCSTNKRRWIDVQSKLYFVNNPAKKSNFYNYIVDCLFFCYSSIVFNLNKLVINEVVWKGFMPNIDDNAGLPKARSALVNRF